MVGENDPGFGLDHGPLSHIGVFGVQQDLQVGHLKKKCRQAVGQAAKSAGLWSLNTDKYLFYDLTVWI